MFRDQPQARAFALAVGVVFPLSPDQSVGLAPSFDSRAQRRGKTWW